MDLAAGARGRKSEGTKADGRRRPSHVTRVEERPMSASLAAAIVGEMDDAALAALAERLAPFLPHPGTDDGDRWMDTKAAAAYLGLTVNALRKLTAERSIPFEQDVRGGKCWFQRSELDAWRRGSPGNPRKRA